MKKAKILVLLLLLMSSSEAVLLSMDSITEPDKVSREYNNEEVMEKLCSYVREKKCSEFKTLLNTLPDNFDVNQEFKSSQTTLLQIAVRENCVEAVRLLLEKGADVNTMHPNSHTTVLMSAVYEGFIDIVRMFLTCQHVKVNQAAKDGYTALFGAALYDRVDVAKLLLEHHADVDARSKDNSTALIIAAKNNQFNVVRLLLEHGADVNACQKNGDTALIVAAERGHVGVVETLLESPNINLFALGLYKKTAISLAQKNNHIEIVRLLENALLEKAKITAPVVEAAPVVAQPCISREAKNMLIIFASGMGGGVLVGCVIWAISCIVQRAEDNATTLAL